MHDESASGSRLDLFHHGTTCSDDPAHSGGSSGTGRTTDVEMIGRHWLDHDQSGTFQSPSWKSCCHVLCRAISQRWTTGLRADDLSAHERRQKAQEWSNVFRCEERRWRLLSCCMPGTKTAHGMLTSARRSQTPLLRTRQVAQNPF